MENPSVEPRPSTPVIARVGFFIAGLIALAIGTIISVGAALVGAIAIGIVAWARRRKERRITRRAAWFASVVATVGVVALFFGWAVLTSDEAKPPTPAQRAEQRARAREAMPDWLKTVSPNAERQSEAADSIATKLLENRAVMVWAGLMATTIAAGLIGTIAGSFAWGGVMLLNRSFSGDWMPSSTDATSI